MQRLFKLLAVSLFLLLPTGAWSALEVVATSSSTGALVREIAAEQAHLTILAPPDRDLHHLQARPSMIRALRGADLVVALGAEIEVGWLPIAIQQAANPQILPGRIGYFEAAAQVTLLDVGGPADRALGDIHPMGNPHINMDPVRMAQVGLALAERLAKLDPSNATAYRQRARAFQHAVDSRLPAWRQLAASAPGVVAYHRDSIYLLERFAVPLLNTIELVPGIPPTAAHIQQLVHTLQGRQGIVLITTYQPEQTPRILANTLGWPLISLPLEPPLNADGAGYLSHIEDWLKALKP
ncbi:ABC transporter substrate-binding protein [Achromatium sp. WMS2]|nr:ABC transporter substrate-binding protein [Achromatium sp. WMS2]